MLNDVRILTTDAQARIGLYAIQYLGKAGAQVTAIGTGKALNSTVGFFSKYITEKRFIQEENYTDNFEKFLTKNYHKYDVINPIFTSSMRKFLDVVKNYSIKCNYLLPSMESLVIADDKELLTKHAQALGLNCPKTYTKQHPSQIENLPASGLTFPSIIKFRGDNRSTHWNPADRYSIVHSCQKLVSEYSRMHKIEEYPIIQEYINGTGYGYFALFDKERRLKAQFCHKRIREYPITGGPSSCCESVYEEKLVQIGRSLFESLDWMGLGMVEFKYDINRKKFYIIEINPRYWGSLPLAVFSGVNFPVLHVLSALDEDYEPVLNYKTGVKVRFIHKDILSIVEHIRKEKRFKKKFRLIFELMNPALKDGLSILDDFKPIIYSLISIC